jgi:hypothetical protein
MWPIVEVLDFWDMDQMVDHPLVAKIKGIS